MLSGVGFSYAPGKSQRGVQQTKGFKYFDPHLQRIVEVSDYHGKSILPSQLGADFMRASEAKLGVLPPVQPDTEFHLNNPNIALREFRERGGMTFDDYMRMAPRAAKHALGLQDEYNYDLRTGARRVA